MAHWESDERGYLRITDVVFIEPDTLVECATFPARLLSGENPYSKRMILRQVRVGSEHRKSEKVDFIKKHIGAVIEGGFEFFKVPLDKGIMKRFIDHQIPTIEEEIFVVPPGLYIITDIIPLRRGQQNVLKTYKPAEGETEHILHFYQGIYHPTNIKDIKVIKNPKEYRKGI
ncbi:hypothetical protein DYBT9623_00671 [Dyadobacter sp. CECT 9623]|uniref:Uncharacterized protein n=1 Tax=Dyadobacter linearis TaxID=2823330 RepID=A0ABN7R482_9BACT|nr:hypothetical protein [Dyadobacter sp. CECT 9623]CAG5067943.1 hypothetical protein DYBT9623_00671 [Dyadobacter sp. CECT 9623]